MEIPKDVMQAYEKLTCEKPRHQKFFDTKIPGKWSGFYCGFIICDTSKPRWKNTLLHELIHSWQHSRIGRYRFPLLYLDELAMNGYWNNKFEIEARLLSNSYNFK